MARTAFSVAIVDDDPNVCGAIGRLVRSLGFRETTFASGDAFLEFLDATRPRLPDVLILDVRMPGVTGLGLQQRLAAAGQRIPIVFITAHENERDRRAALAAGAVAYLPKPFDDALLVRALAVARDQAGDGGNGDR